MRRPSRPLLLVLALALAACGGGGGGGGGASSTVAPSTSATTGGASSGAVAVPGSSTRTVAGSPVLVAARLADKDASGGPSAGDVLTLVFDRTVQVQSADPARDLTFAPGDGAGAGATLAQGGKPEEAALVLGQGPVLSLFETYLPGRPAGPGASPAVVSLAAARKVDAFVSATGDPAADAPRVAVVLEDPDAAPKDQGRPFVDPPLAQARAVFGNLHAHTGYSDGQLDPQDAHRHVKALPGRHGFDFMSTTDHLEQLSQHTWDNTQLMAAAEAAPDFVTLQGFEWGHGYIPPIGWYNHINIVGTTHRVSLLDTLTPSGLYREALRHCFPDGAIGIFNHPHISKPPLQFNQWDDLRHDPAGDKLMSLIDCEGNGSSQTAQLGYLPALLKGWRLAPSSNQDNHSSDWGNKDEGRTGVWVASLDRASILKAIREGRAFSTGDRDARVRLIADGKLWMGSTVVSGGRVALRVEADDAGGEPFARVDLVSNGRVVASQALGAGPVVFEHVVDPANDAYVYAHVVQQDGDELFSAPIYIDR